MKTKVCFYSWNQLTDIFLKMGDLINSDSVEVIHATYSEKEVKRLQKLDQDKIYVLQKKIQKEWSSEPEQTIEYYTEKYDLPSMMQLVYADRHIREYKNITIIKKFVLLHIEFWEMFFKKERPDFLVSEAVSCLSLYLAYLIGKKYNCKYLGITHSRIPGKFYISEDEFGYIKKLDILSSNKMLHHSHIEAAEEFVENFKTNKTKPSYMINQSKPPRLGNPLRIGSYYLNNEKDYFYTNGNIGLIKAIKRKILQKSRYYLLSKFNNRFFENPQNESFVLFAVHFQPEASTMIQAPFYENQVALIENIAKSLPAGVMLYVKDHYAALGSKNLNFYMSVKKLPNVRLINPYVDSHSLIKSADVVMTITGTVGWEAILYDKPVIIFGNVFYDRYEHVKKVTDITTLPLVIREILANKDRSYAYDRNHFISSYLRCLYDGEFDVDNLAVTNRKENIGNLCTGLIEFINLAK